MPATFESIASEKATVLVPIKPSDPESDQIRVTYRPAELSPEMVERAVKAGEDTGNGTVEQSMSMVLSVVTDWDLRWKAADTDPIPLEREQVKKLPSFLLDAIVRAILEHQQPDPTTKKSSSQGG